MSPKKKVEENGVVNEIDEMLKTFGSSPSEDSSEESDDKLKKDTEDKEGADEADKVDDDGEKDDDKESSDSEEGDKDADDLDKDEEADADQPDEDDQDEPDEKDKEISDLKGRLDTFEVEKKETERKEVAIAAATAEKEKEEKEKEEELKFEDQDFVGEVDVEDIVHDKESFNRILNEVHKNAILKSREVVGEHILRDIPNLVKANIEIYKELSETRETFYKDNPDLKAFPKVVASVFEEVSAKNPDKGYKDLLDEVGKEARGRLDLHKKATEKTVKEGEKPPRLPEKKGARTSKSKPDVSSLETQIDEMNKTVKP